MQLNHQETFQCVTAERAFLAGMGGGCQSPVAAYTVVNGNELQMEVLSFASGPLRKASATRPLAEATELGRQLAEELKPK
jgi:hydroxymethylbilane synthase